MVSTSASDTYAVFSNFMNSTPTLDSCASIYQDFVFPTGGYCNWTYDSFLCWPPTSAGTVVRQKCPNLPGIDTTKLAERQCSTEGQWERKPGTHQTNSVGWTNYTPCYSPEMLKLFKKLYINEDDAKAKFDIAERTRTIEFVGFSVSLAALLLSLLIFCRFRTLRNNRTKIHKNLFIAMVIQVLIRLTLYIDQAVARNSTVGGDIGNEIGKNGIDNTPFLCEASYILLEYAKTAMFMWMFIEGLYLHNVLTVTVFQGRFPYKTYILLGWGGPIIMTAIWALATAASMAGQNLRCWWGYNLTGYYFILEGPRFAIIILNLIFLLNIIRVLVVKLRQSHTSDVEQVRRAVRAAFVLLPLLGITNAMNMVEAPLDRTPLEFAMWSYTTHFLTSFQGFFCALLYCFLNGEVRAALLKSLSVYMSIRGHHDWAFRRPSMFSAAYNTAADTEAANCNEIFERNNLKDTLKPVDKHCNAKVANIKQNNWIQLCFCAKKDIRRDPPDPVPPESVVFELTD